MDGMDMDRKNKRPFSPMPPGRTPPAATPRPRRWRRPQRPAAARRSAAERRLDMRLRIGEGEVSGVSRCEGLGTTGWGKPGGKRLWSKQV